MNGNIALEESTNVLKRPESDPFFYPLLALFAATVLSGLFMAIYYVPSFAQAFLSVERLEQQIPFGWFLRRMHGTGAVFSLLLLFLTLLRTLYTGEYKGVPRSLWVMTVLSLTVAVIASFTGFLFPLSQTAFWGTATILSGIGSIPWIGAFLVHLLRGGNELGGAALVRFYGAHIGAAVLMGVLLAGLYSKRSAEKTAHWNLPFLAMAVGLVLASITFVPGWFADPLREMANPMANPDSVVPPWYFLFFEEAIKFFTGGYPFWSGVALLLCLALLFLLPFIDRGPERRLLLRPVILAAGSASLVLLLYFTLVGAAHTPYGERVILPGNSPSPEIVRGARIFAEKNCAYCHQVSGREGRREGPDMLVVKQRKRSPEWVRRYILNARLYEPGTTMPRYDMVLTDLEALSAYLLALDPNTTRLRAVERKELIDFGLDLYVKPEDQRFETKAPIKR